MDRFDFLYKILALYLPILTISGSDYPLLVSPELIQVREGGNIEAKCIVKDLGNFPTDYSFGWNLKDKTNSTAREETSSKKEKVLRIHNAKRQDAGSYRCQLSADGRNIEKTLQISVIDSAIGIPCFENYQCKDSRLIHCNYRCNGRVDCPFGDDEEDCSKNKEIYPKEKDIEDDQTAWLKTTVYTVIACTVGVVLFISIVVIAVCRIKMKRAALRRAAHQSERRRRHGHHGSDHHGSSSRAQRNNATEHEPFISAPSPTHFGNIIVNVNNGVQYVPNVDFHTIIQSPPTYQEVLAETQREALVGRHSPPPLYSTIDRNPQQLSCDGRDLTNNQFTETTPLVSDRQINIENRHEINMTQQQTTAGNQSGMDSSTNQNNRSNTNRFNMPGMVGDPTVQIQPSAIIPGRDGTRSLERLCRNRLGGPRSRPNVRSIAVPQRPKQLQVRDGHIVLDEHSSASSSPETVNRNTQTNLADITQSNRSSIVSTNQSTGSCQTPRENTEPNVSSPTQNKPAQLRVQAGQIVLEEQHDVPSVLTEPGVNDLEVAACSQGHLEVKDGHIVFKTP